MGIFNTTRHGYEQAAAHRGVLAQVELQRAAYEVDNSEGRARNGQSESRIENCDEDCANDEVPGKSCPVARIHSGVSHGGGKQELWLALWPRAALTQAIKARSSWKQAASWHQREQKEGLARKQVLLVLDTIDTVSERSVLSN